MDDIKVGDKLAIHCYKHNGKIDRISDEATVLEITDEMLVVANYKAKLTESDGRSHRTNETAIIFFYKNKWFNVIAQLKKPGLFYYCNIATPYLIDDKVIKYIDYDLDLRVFPDGGFRVLDRNEYNYHKKVMGYSNELDLIIRTQLTELIEMKRALKGPFEPGIVTKYYNMYEKL